MGTVDFRKPVGASSSTLLGQASISKLQGRVGRAEGVTAKQCVALGQAAVSYQLECAGRQEGTDTALTWSCEILTPL